MRGRGRPRERGEGRSLSDRNSVKGRRKIGDSSVDVRK